MCPDESYSSKIFSGLYLQIRNKYRGSKKMDVLSTSEYMNGLNIFMQTGFGVDIILPFMCT